MLYSKVDKIKHILKNYNIVSSYCPKSADKFSFRLKNLKTNLYQEVDSDMPMLNILQIARPTKLFAINDLLEEAYVRNYKMALIDLDEHQSGYDEFKNKYLSSEYFNRFQGVHYKDNYYGTEYFTLLTNEDTDILLTLSGVTDEYTVSIFGKFILTNTGNLRLIYNPTILIGSNIKDVLFTDFYLHDSGGYIYPIYYGIFTKTNDPENVKLFYYNAIVDSISKNGKVEVSLRDVFGTSWQNIYSDMLDISKKDNKFFILSNLYNLGIFVNNNNGILRYICNIFPRNFFKIAKYNMDINSDTVAAHFCVSHTGLDENGSSYDKKLQLGNLRANGSIKYGYILHKDYWYNLNYSRPELISYDVNVYIDNKINISLKTINDDRAFKNITNITSNAQYYNDIIFSIVANTEDLSIPIFYFNEV